MHKRLHIAVICDSIDSTLGGSYVSAQRFARGLADQGHQIVWCTSQFLDLKKKKEFGYAKLYEFPSLFPLGPQKVRFAYPSIHRLVDIFEHEKIDIVYNIHPSYIGWQAYRAAKRLNIPIVSHSHIYAQLLLPGLPGRLQSLIKKLIAAFYRKCDGIIYPTDFAKKDFNEYHFQNKQIVISNGVDTTLFHPSKDRGGRKFTILSVGRLDPEKNISMLLDALHLLKTQKKLSSTISCTIVGGGSEGRKLLALVRSYGLEDVVHFTGKIAALQVIPFYQHCSVYVLNSLFELESMSTLEAMACGCPILIANSGHSAAKFFVQNNGYLFDPNEMEDLAQKLVFLIDHPNLLKKMSTKSMEQSVGFSFDKSIDKLASFFLSLCRK